MTKIPASLEKIINKVKIDVKNDVKPVVKSEVPIRFMADEAKNESAYGSEHLVTGND